MNKIESGADIVGCVMNELEHGYGVEELDGFGLPTAQEIAAKIPVLDCAPEMLRMLRLVLSDNHRSLSFNRCNEIRELVAKASGPAITHKSCVSPLGAKECEACGGHGWLIFTVNGRDDVPDGTYMVLRCDECESYRRDLGARQAARRAGLKVEPGGVVSAEEVKRWMDLYPNRGIAQ